MIVKNMLLEKIKEEMDLNIYEAKVWTSLLSRGIASAGELSEISSVPRSRCYDVLESLEKKGFVFMKIGKPIKYIAVQPEEVIETLKKKTRIEKRSAMSLIESMEESDTFDELKTLYSSGINHIDSDDVSSSIIGRANINNFLKDMLANANNNVAIHTTEKGVKRKLKVLKKGIPKKTNITIHAPLNGSKLETKNIKFNKKDVALRFIQSGDEVLLFTSPEEIDPEQEAAIWVKNKFICQALTNFLN